MAFLNVASASVRSAAVPVAGSRRSSAARVDEANAARSRTSPGGGTGSRRARAKPRGSVRERSAAAGATARAPGARASSTTTRAGGITHRHASRGGSRQRRRRKRRPCWRVKASRRCAAQMGGAFATEPKEGGFLGQTRSLFLQKNTVPGRPPGSPGHGQSETGISQRSQIKDLKKNVPIELGVGRCTPPIAAPPLAIPPDAVDPRDVHEHHQLRLTTPSRRCPPCPPTSPWLPPTCAPPRPSAVPVAPAPSASSRVASRPRPSRRLSP